MEGNKSTVTMIEVRFKMSPQEANALIDIVRNPQCDPADEPEIHRKVRQAVYDTIVEGNTGR